MGLEEVSDHAFHGRYDRPVDHHRAFPLRPADEPKVKALGKLKIDLNCGKGFLPSLGVAYLEVDLRAIKSGLALGLGEVEVKVT